MDVHALQDLKQAFAAYAARMKGLSPIYATLAAGLGAGPSPAAADLMSRFYRISSQQEPNVALLLGALHHLALTGEAPGLARFFPSCGGAFRPASDADALVAAADAALAERRDDLLDYLLSHDLQTHVVERSTAVLLGAAAAADRFGGGVCLVEVGCIGGLNLLFDRYAYQLGEARVGDSPLVLSADVSGLKQPVTMPPVVGRYGLDLQPRDLTDPAERRLLESFLPPDRSDLIEHLRMASAMLPDAPRLDLRSGAAEADLYPLLAEAYTAMPEGNTLLIVDLFVWPYLSDKQRQAMTYQIQHLAAQLQPRKPAAWLQLEPFGPAGTVELKLHTFGWADKEDRAVRRLAETDAYVTRVQWLEG